MTTRSRVRFRAVRECDEERSVSETPDSSQAPSPPTPKRKGVLRRAANLMLPVSETASTVRSARGFLSRLYSETWVPLVRQIRDRRAMRDVAPAPLVWPEAADVPALMRRIWVTWAMGLLLTGVGLAMGWQWVRLEGAGFVVLLNMGLAAMLFVPAGLTWSLSSARDGHSLRRRVLIPLGEAAGSPAMWIPPLPWTMRGPQ
jgi:hypothetical protein